jgi:hypothetical protein
VTLYVKENNKKAASFSDGKLGAREDTIWEGNFPLKSCFEKKLSCPLLKYQSTLAALTHVCHIIN